MVIILRLRSQQKVKIQKINTKKKKKRKFTSDFLSAENSEGFIDGKGSNGVAKLGYNCDGMFISWLVKP